MGRDLECKQLRTSLLTVSCTCLRVWVINGARDVGQLACVVGQLNAGSAYFGCGFLLDGSSSGGGVVDGLTAIGAQIASATKGVSGREAAAMFPSIYSVVDWLKQRADKPKLLARDKFPLPPPFSPVVTLQWQVLLRCSHAAEWLQLAADQDH